MDFERGIKKIEVDKDILYLRKSKYFGWKIVKPIKIDGKINWKNLISGGSWFNLLWIAILVIGILGAVSEYTNAVKLANECLQSQNLILNLTGLG